MKPISLDSKYANKKVTDMTGAELAQVIAAGVEAGADDTTIENLFDRARTLLEAIAKNTQR